MVGTKVGTIAVAIAVSASMFFMAGCGKDGGAPGAAEEPGDVTRPASDDATPPVVLTANDAGLISATGPADACPSAAGCPPGYACGRYEDPCTGQVFACGSPCTGGQICAVDANDASAQRCQPKECTGKCGVLGTDSCGVAISCGGCSAGQDCVDNECVDAGGPSDAGSPRSDGGQCAAPTCAPDPNTALCGTVTNGCGDTKTCSCPAGQSCQGGLCGAAPPECGDPEGGSFCGSMPNACGSGDVTCASCSGSSECTDHVCTGCTPPTCGSALCGSVSNGCGPAVTCGSCAGTEICYEGACCTAPSCAEAQDAGLVTGCSAIELGCGVQKSCATCGEGQVCTNNECVACTPKTCADFGDAGCGHSNGCGNTLDCCAAGLTCQGSICCPPGQVAYNATCCEPSCDPTLPSGSQISRGQVIYCTASGSSGGSGIPR